MAALKNFRHELFVRRLFANGGCAADAYRDVSRRLPWKKTGINNPKCYRNIAHVLRKRPDIQRREQELKEIMAKKSDITIEKVLTDLQEALVLARKFDKPNEMINAAMSQAKLVGLLRDRVETGAVGDFDNAENVADILEKIGHEVGPEAALALAKAWGLDNAETAQNETKAEPEDSALAQAIPPSDAVN